MLIQIATTHRPATDLGYLLGKHPQRSQRFELAFGVAHVFYPQADAERCCVALLLELDPVALVRGSTPDADGPLAHYVNDRPYVASSFLSVALTRVFRSAMAGTCASHPELAATPLPFEVELPVLRSHGGVATIERCFAPLGYRLEATRLPLDARFPEWGESPYYALRLAHTVTLKELLSHLYVLLPAIDGDKHYYVGDDEVEKLVARGEGWLAAHPDRDWIALRYLKRRKPLVRAALARLLEAEEEEIDATEAVREAAEETIERPLSLNEQRMQSVLEELRGLGATSVLDLGCGEGRLLGLLLKENQFQRIAGVDVALRALDRAHDRLHLERMPAARRERIALLQGALTYRDRRLAGYDVACAVEVIEHIDASRLGAFERTLFEHARPNAIVVTTPNVEYNVLFESMPAGRLRHPDHRFEWTRAEFQAWANAAAARHGYSVEFKDIGPVHATHGSPTQMGVFRR